MSQKNSKKKMSPRCPRKLEFLPDSWCPMAVLRLKALRNAGRELTEEEESKLPGCPWAINHQLANYCFFKYMADYLNQDSLPSHSEIAHMLNVSVDTVKKCEKGAIEKGRQREEIKELIDSHDNVLDDGADEDSYRLIK
jgi:hypothetical protein